MSPRTKSVDMSEDAQTGYLVRLAKEGDRRAFDQLLSLYRNRIYNYVLHTIRDPVEAEDVTQSTFIKAYRHLPSFRGASKFLTWLYRIASNQIIDVTRQMNRRANAYSSDVSLNVDGEEMLREFESDGCDDPQSSLETKQTQRMVHQAVDRLSDKLRSVLVLREFLGLDYQELAEVLGVPIGTVKSRLFSARAALGRLVRDAGLFDDLDEPLRQHNVQGWGIIKHGREENLMPWLAECGKWGVYPVFASLSDQTRMGCCLINSGRGHIRFLDMMQGSGPCELCQERSELRGKTPVAQENPPCGCYFPWSRDECGGEPKGTCMPTGKSKVAFRDMISGVGCCQECKQRTVESARLQEIRRQAPQSPEEGTTMVELTEDFQRRLHSIGDTPIIRAVNQEGFPGIYVGSDTVRQYFDHHHDEILQDGDLLSDFARALGFEIQDLRSYLTSLTEAKRVDRITAENHSFNTLSLFDKLGASPDEGSEFGGAMSFWALMARAVRETAAGECPVKLIGSLAKTLGIPRVVVIECGLKYLEKAGEITERPALTSLPADLAEALTAFQQDDRCTFLRKRAERVTLLPEELSNSGLVEFLESLVAGHPAMVALNERVDNGYSDLSVEDNLAHLKYFDLEPVNVCPAIMAATGTTLRQATLIYSKIDPVQPTLAEKRDTEGLDSSGAGGSHSDKTPTFEPVPAFAESDLPASLTPGTFKPGKKGGWQQLASNYVCDPHPLFSANLDMPADRFAALLSRAGVGKKVIAYVLGGAGLPSHSVSQSLSALRGREGIGFSPSRDDLGKYVSLNSLVPANSDDPPVPPPPSPEPEPEPEPVPEPRRKPDLDIVTTADPTPDPGPAPEPEPSAKRRVYASDLAMIEVIPDLPPAALMDALESLRSGTTLAKLLHIVRRCEEEGRPIHLKPLKESGEPEE